MSLLLLTACGGNGTGAAGVDGGGTCRTVAACGGDLRGTWKVTASCLEAYSLDRSSCPQETLGARGFGETGSYLFKDDMSYAANVTASGSFTVAVPGACVTSDLTTTCGSLDSFYKSFVQQAGSLFESAGCVVSGSDCDCTFMASGQAVTTTGTYAPSGATAVALTPATATTVQTSSYCVEETTLYWGSISSASSSMVGALVLTKQ